jgi:hypothetical protein
MNMNPEHVPTTWTTADETFFRVVEGVLSPAYTAGAGVLLSSYDFDSEPTVATPVAGVPCRHRTSRAATPRPA